MSAGLPPDRRPNLLGIGAAKCGTTWLAGVLADHPDIFVHPQKELNALVYNDLNERLDEYAAYFERGAAAKIRCDFTVRYLTSANALAAAARLTPDAKLLLLIRNPVDQVQSHYWHLRRQNFHQHAPVEPLPDLFQALERFPELLLEPALYGKHVQRWLKAFPRERLLILDSHQLSKDPEAVLNEICDFLGVSSHDFSEAIRGTSVQEGRGGVSPRQGLSERVFARLYTTIAQGPYMWLKRVVGVERADRLKRVLKFRETAEVLFFKAGYPKLDPDARARLFGIFREDIERLATLAPFVQRWSANS